MEISIFNGFSILTSVATRSFYHHKKGDQSWISEQTFSEWMFSERLSCIRLKNHEDGRPSNFQEKRVWRWKNSQVNEILPTSSETRVLSTIPKFENYLSRYLSLEGWKDKAIFKIHLINVWKRQMPNYSWDYSKWRIRLRSLALVLIKLGTISSILLSVSCKRKLTKASTKKKEN